MHIDIVKSKIFRCVFSGRFSVDEIMRTIPSPDFVNFATLSKNSPYNCGTTSDIFTVIASLLYCFAFFLPFIRESR